MTAVERAKQFIRNKGRAIALTVVPLAALTVASPPAARAGLISPPLTFDTATCSVTDSSGTCAISQLPAGANGVTGVSMTGSSSANISSGGITIDENYSASGLTNSGSFTGSMPFAWDFTISNGLDAGSPGSQSVTWSLTIDFNGSPVVSEGGSTLGGPISGSINVPIDGEVDNYSIALDFSGETGPNASDFLDVSVPAGSVDINAIPEPATLPLAGAALAALAWRRRRKLRSLARKAA